MANFIDFVVLFVLVALASVGVAFITLVLEKGAIVIN